MIWCYAPLVPSHKLDRIQEVLLCEKELINDNLNQPLPFFLNLSFDEVSVHMFLHIRWLWLPNVIIVDSVQKKTTLSSSWKCQFLSPPWQKGLKFPWGWVRLNWNFHRDGLSSMEQVHVKIFSGTTNLYKIYLKRNISSTQQAIWMWFCVARFTQGCYCSNRLF